jgi:hypothetical protein
MIVKSLNPVLRLRNTGAGFDFSNRLAPVILPYSNFLSTFICKTFFEKVLNLDVFPIPL